MDVLLGAWIVVTGMIMFFDGYFIILDVDSLRRKTPTKEDRKELRIMILVFFTAWLWPLLIPAGIGFAVWKGIEFLRDAYRIAFGRQPEAPVKNGKPTGAELRRQQEISRQAHANRAARKEERRRQMYSSDHNHYASYFRPSDDEQFIEEMRGHR